MNSALHPENRILIVDDEQPIREILLKVLSLLGYAVVEVNNGREAMEAFGQRHFDLVITDMDMPEVDGLTLASLIKQRSPHTPVLMITGTGEQDIKSSSIDVVMYKPFQLAELETTVHGLLT